MMKIQKSAIKVGVLIAGVMSLSACFDSDDTNFETVSPNQAPSAVSVNLLTQTEVPITDQLSGSDPDGDALTFVLFTQPQLGSISLNSSGSYTYQPFNEVTGSDSFTYVVKDAGGLEASATVNITIEALEVSFLSYSREAFAAAESDSPLRLNGRVIIKDTNDQTDYQDLIDGN
ncbi:MAG: VCBS repeat-containing protein [Glaciecola sp.]|jgi:VCBS repeat-containing protein